MEKSQKNQDELEKQLFDKIETELLLESIAFLEVPLKPRVFQFWWSITESRDDDFYSSEVVLLAWFRLYSLIPECRVEIIGKLIPWLSEAIEETFDDITQGINLISSIVNEKDQGQMEFLRIIKEVNES